MSPNNCIRKRIERHSAVSGESFRVEVIKTDGETETTVYTRAHKGSINVEETTDGSFRLNGTTEHKCLIKRG